MGNKLSGPYMPDPDDEIDLSELWGEIWAGRHYIIVPMLACTLLAMLFAYLQPDVYKASALVTVTSTSESVGLSGLSSRLGGLASLANVNLSGDGADKGKIAQEILLSWGFLEDFIRKREISPEVYAAIGWDRMSNQIIFDENLYDKSNKKWVRSYDESKGEKPEPNGWELYERFSQLLKVNQDGGTGFIRISVEHYSPILARDWVSQLIEDINSEMRRRDIEDAEKNIEFLEKQIEATSINDMKAILYSMIEEQTQTLMLAQTSDEYLLKTINRPQVPYEPESPNRFMIVIIGCLIGLAIGVTLIIGRKVLSNVSSAR